MHANLKLGTVKVDITPKEPVPLAGYGSRQGNFTDVVHPLAARIFLFEQVTPAGEKKRALFVTADVIWWGEERVADLKPVLSTRFGIDEAAIILHATHSHSGPQTSDRFTETLGEMDIDYLNYMESQLFAGVYEAEENLEPVAIRKGTGTCDIGINRRSMVDGQITMKPNPDGPRDPEVTVISFLAENERMKGMFVHYTCHPTTTADNRVSFEFPGWAMTQLEDTLGEDVVCGYLQGCCGDVRPALVEEGSFYRGSQADIERLGNVLGAEVSRILRSPMADVPSAPLRGESVAVALPFESLPSREQLERVQEEPGVLGERSRLLLADPDRLQPTIPLNVTCLQLGDGVSLLAMNGEMVVAYGLYAKKVFQGGVLPLGYSNGMIGYVSTAKQLQEGGYEAKGSTAVFGLPSEFSQEAEGRIRQAINHLKDSVLS